MKRISVLSLLTFAMMAFCTLLACGGGTTGTDGGGSSLRVLGSVLFQDGLPLSGGVVSVLETGDRATIDADGNFEIPRTALQNATTFLIEFQGNELTTEPVAVDSTQSVVAVQLIVARAGPGLEVVELNIVPLGEPPSVSGTPEPASAKPVPTSQPTRTPSVAGRPTARPTTVPSPTPTPEPHVLRGSIVDRNSNPVGDVGIQLRQPSSILTTSTDQLGTFTLPVDNGPSTLTIFVTYDGVTSPLDIAGIPSTPSTIRVGIRLKNFPRPIPTPGEPVESAAAGGGPELELLQFTARD